MGTMQQFSVTLPLDITEAVEQKIRSGGYASVSEVVRDGVRALLEHIKAKSIVDICNDFTAFPQAWHPT